MTYVAVTVEYEKKSLDLALPMHIPTRLLVDGMVRQLALPEGKGYFLGVKSEQGLRRISSNANLGDMNVLHGMRLTLMDEGQSSRPLVETGACLRANNGTVFYLTSKTTMLGRSDPKSGIFVDVDLGPLVSDPKILSRRHAQIEQEGDRFYLTDVGSVNGTKLNGTRLPAREKKPIWDGDVLEFGKGGVQLFFQGGGKKKE